MTETKTVELYGPDWFEKVKEIESQGWSAVAKEPIERATIEIIGQKFTFERVKP